MDSEKVNKNREDQILKLLSNNTQKEENTQYYKKMCNRI